MANQYIQVINNIIQFDNGTYRVDPTQENGIPVIIVSKISDSTVQACKIYGTVIYWLLPIAQITITAAPFGNGMKVTIT